MLPVMECAEKPLPVRCPTISPTVVLLAGTWVISTLPQGRGARGEAAEGEWEGLWELDPVPRV